MYTQALKEEIVPTAQCFQLSHQVTLVFMMERKICALFSLSGGPCQGLCRGVRLMLGERNEILRW